MAFFLHCAPQEIHTYHAFSWCDFGLKIHLVFSPHHTMPITAPSLSCGFTKSPLFKPWLALCFSAVRTSPRMPALHCTIQCASAMSCGFTKQPFFSSKNTQTFNFSCCAHIKGKSALQWCAVLMKKEHFKPCVCRCGAHE